MDNINTVIGQNIKRCRESLKLTPEMLAGDADISIKHLKSIEAGSQNTSVFVLEKIAQHLMVSVTDLFMTDHSVNEANENSAAAYVSQYAYDVLKTQNNRDIYRTYRLLGIVDNFLNNRDEDDEELYSNFHTKVNMSKLGFNELEE